MEARTRRSPCCEIVSSYAGSSLTRPRRPGESLRMGALGLAPNGTSQATLIALLAGRISRQ